MQEKLKSIIERALASFGVPSGMVAITLDHPTDIKFGDYSTNVAMLLSKQLGASTKNPFDLAEKIVAKIQDEIGGKNTKKSFIEKAEAVKPGFINFYLSKEFFASEIKEILEKNIWYGKSSKLWKEKVIVEYTDPNPFKELHIGHLMSNTIGESLSRIVELNGAEVARACYQGDVGLHVAKALYGWLKHPEPWPDETSSLPDKAKFLGLVYTQGASAYEADESAKKEIIEINRKIYERSDQAVNEMYDAGKKWSLGYFDLMYKKLGTHFNYFFFESATGSFGKKVVEEHIADGIFEESDKAIVFKGEKYDSSLHTRVFINSEGLPTYEAKELGLAKIKYDAYPYTTSIVVTGNEIKDYFRVLLKAMECVFPELAAKTIHKPHGMLRLPTGKMSSRSGNVITAESLISQVEEMVKEKIKDRNFDEKTQNDVAEKVAIAAIKYSILRQGIGKDIIFDFDTSLSFEGDSGPYLQYAYVRAASILAKAEQEGIKADPNVLPAAETSRVEKLLYRFPEIIERAGVDYSPNIIATYLIELAGAFNNYYAHTKIVDSTDEAAPYKVALTKAVSTVIKNGLYVLGIAVTEKM